MCRNFKKQNKTKYYSTICAVVFAAISASAIAPLSAAAFSSAYKQK